MFKNFINIIKRVLITPVPGDYFMDSDTRTIYTFSELRSGRFYLVENETEFNKNKKDKMIVIDTPTFLFRFRETNPLLESFKDLREVQNSKKPNPYIDSLYVAFNLEK